MPQMSVICQCGERIIVPQESVGTSFVCPVCMRTTLISPEVATAETQPLFLKPLRVLLVEDSLVLRKILRKTLESAKYDVVEATDGAIALHVIRLSKPDIIILDYNMPNKSGIDCLKELKAMEKTKHIPAMMCTSNADRDLVMDCVRAGATDYIVKPVKEKNLLEKVGRLAGMVKSIQFDTSGNQQTVRASEETGSVTTQSNQPEENDARNNGPAPHPYSLFEEKLQSPPDDYVDENPYELFRRLPYNANIQRVIGFYIGEIGNIYTVEEIARKANVDAEWLNSVLQLFEDAGFFKIKLHKVEFVKPFNKGNWRKLMDWSLEYVASGENTSGDFERFFEDRN